MSNWIERELTLGTEFISKSKMPDKNKPLPKTPKTLLRTIDDIQYLDTMPLSFYNIIKDHVMGIVVEVCYDDKYDDMSTYTKSESAELCNALGITPSRVQGIRDLKIPGFAKLVETEARRKSEEWLRLVEGGIQKELGDQKEANKQLEKNISRLEVLVADLRIEKEEFKNKLEKELADKHQFIISKQDEQAVELVGDKKELKGEIKELQSKIDNLYEQLAAYSNIPNWLVNMFK